MVNRRLPTRGINRPKYLKVGDLINNDIHSHLEYDGQGRLSPN